MTEAEPIAYNHEPWLLRRPQVKLVSRDVEKEATRSSFLGPSSSKDTSMVRIFSSMEARRCQIEDNNIR